MKLAYVLSILFVIFLLIVGAAMLTTKKSVVDNKTPTSEPKKNAPTDTAAEHQQEN